MSSDCKSSQTCSVAGCSNYRLKCARQGKKLRWYNFPSRPWNQDRRLLWIKFAKRVEPDGTEWTPRKWSAICSEHFVGGVKSEDPRHPAYNPTIFNPQEPPKEDPKVLLDRYKRMVVRWNRQKEETKAREAAALPPASPPSAIIDLESSAGSPLSSLESDITAEESVPIQGPKELLCLLCCQPCPPSQFQSYSTSTPFLHFCRYLYPTPRHQTSFLKSLQNSPSLSLCVPCLASVSSTTAQMNAVQRHSKIVTDLQTKLVEELKRLQSHVHQLKTEFQKMQDSIETSDKQLLQEHLTPDLTPNQIDQFRQKIGQSANSLEEFRQDLHRKVDCHGDVNRVRSPSPVSLDSPEPLDTSDPCPPPSGLTSRRMYPPPSNTPRIMGRSTMTKWGRKLPVKHVWTGTKFTTLFPPLPPRPPPPPPKKPVVTTVQCPACQKQMRSYSLLQHRQYSCPKTASSRDKLLCHLCSKEFKRRIALEQHLVERHSEERPFLCSQCPKAWASRNQLKIHEKSHSEERPFVCRKGCGGGFKTKRVRWGHEKLCDGEGTPYRKKAKPVAPPILEVDKKGMLENEGTKRADC